MKVVCPVCTQEVPPGTEWCPNCGTPLMEGAADTTFVGREQDVGGRPTMVGAPALGDATSVSPALERTVIRSTGEFQRPGPPVMESDAPAHDATVVRRAHEPSMTPFDDLEQGFADTSVNIATLGPRPIAEKIITTRVRDQPVTTPEGKAAPGTPDAEALIGTKLGDYTLKSVLGTGSMGVVYEGFHALIGKRVAIKLLKRDAADNEEEASRFLEEARAANAVGHRGIIDIFGFDKAPDGRPYFVMEFLQGQSLGAYLEKFAPLPVPQALQLLDEILAALGAAHQAGVIHRDLKPNNIFLVSQPDKTMYVKVLDFGLAKRSQFARGDTPQTSVSRLVGTPDYMAPEQARGEPVGPRSDLYSLGCITFEMLAGRPPFVAKTGWEVVAMHMSTEPQALSELNSSVPQEFSDLVLRLLSKMPAERPDTAEALREELKLIRRGLRVEETRLHEVAREPVATLVGTDATMQNLAPPRRSTTGAIPEGTAQTPPPRRNSTGVIPDSTAQNSPPPRRSTTGAIPATTQPSTRVPVMRTTEPAASTFDGTETLPPGGPSPVRSLSSETVASLGDLRPRVWPYWVGSILFVVVLVAISVVLARSSRLPDPPRDPPLRPAVIPPLDPPPADPTPGPEIDPTPDAPAVPPETQPKRPQPPKNPKVKKGPDATHRGPGRGK